MFGSSQRLAWRTRWQILYCRGTAGGRRRRCRHGFCSGRYPWDIVGPGPIALIHLRGEDGGSAASHFASCSRRRGHKGARSPRRGRRFGSIALRLLLTEEGAQRGEESRGEDGGSAASHCASCSRRRGHKGARSPRRGRRLGSITPPAHGGGGTKGRGVPRRGRRLGSIALRLLLTEEGARRHKRCSRQRDRHRRRARVTQRGDGSEEQEKTAARQV